MTVFSFQEDYFFYVPKIYWVNSNQICNWSFDILQTEHLTATILRKESYTL